MYTHQINGTSATWPGLTFMRSKRPTWTASAKLLSIVLVSTREASTMRILLKWGVYSPSRVRVSARKEFMSPDCTVAPYKCHKNTAKSPGHKEEVHNTQTLACAG